MDVMTELINSLDTTGYAWGRTDGHIRDFDKVSALVFISHPETF